MGWMGAIYTDVEELRETVMKSARGRHEDVGELGETLQEVHGWVAPTVAGLTRSLINEVMERTPHDEADTKQMERVIALLGTGA